MISFTKIVMIRCHTSKSCITLHRFLFIYTWHQMPSSALVTHKCDVLWTRTDTIIFLMKIDNGRRSRQEWDELWMSSG